MIIGQFSEAYPPVLDGVSAVVYDYVHGLRKFGDDCYAIVSGTNDMLKYDKIMDDKEVFRSIMHVIPLISPYGYTIIRPEVKRKVASIDFDIVHAHSPFMLGRYAIKTARKKNIPVVMTFHSQYRKDIKRVVKSEFITNLVMKYVIHSFNLADYVWAVNGTSADVLRSYGFKGKIDIVNNFCNFKKPTEEENQILRKEGREYLGLGDGPVALFIGQQRKEKNLDLVLAAIKILKTEGFYCTLVSVGAGPDSDKYNSIIKEYDIGDRVIFTGKISDRELLKRIYSASDLLTFPSLYDNASIVIIEASAFALPSLLINGAVCSEGAINDFNAFLTEENADIYAAAMKRIFSNAELRYNVGHNAQNTLFKSKESAINDVRERYIQIIAAYKNRNGMI